MSVIISFLLCLLTPLAPFFIRFLYNTCWVLPSNYQRLQHLGVLVLYDCKFGTSGCYHRVSSSRCPFVFLSMTHYQVSSLGSSGHFVLDSCSVALVQAWFAAFAVRFSTFQVERDWTVLHLPDVVKV